jgi:hypothetical protein
MISNDDGSASSDGAARRRRSLNEGELEGVDGLLDNDDNLDRLLNSFSGGGAGGSNVFSSNVSATSSQSMSGREGARSTKYNPLQLASGDLVRSFVNGPSNVTAHGRYGISLCSDCFHY